MTVQAVPKKKIWFWKKSNNTSAYDHLRYGMLSMRDFEIMGFSSHFLLRLMLARLFHNLIMGG
jgi:hypothetical protein